MVPRTDEDEPVGIGRERSVVHRPICRLHRSTATITTLVAAVTLLTVAPRPAAAATLSWSAPVDFQGNALLSVSCPSENLCVAGSSKGLLVSTDPSGGAGAWRLVIAPPAPRDNAPAVYGVSCPSTSFCIAVGGYAILTSSDPAGGPVAWKVTPIPAPSGRPLDGLSCASSSLCVAYKSMPGGTLSGGRVLSSTDPAGGAGAWQASTLREVPDSVDCVRSGLCLLGTRRGDVLTSTHPTRGARAWRSVHIAGIPGVEDDVTSVACASRRYCLAAALSCSGRCSVLLRSSHPTATAPFSWRQVDFGFYPHNRFALLVGGSCLASGFCTFMAPIFTFAGNVVGGEAMTTTGTGSRWTRSSVGGASSAVSCASPRFCVAVGNTGSSFAKGQLTIGEG
jgi:hypothetical protein